MKYNYTLIRSKRKSLSLQIDQQGILIVRSPIRMSILLIEDFIMIKKDWIEKYRQRAIRNQGSIMRKKYSEMEILEMKQKLTEYIIPRIIELSEGKNLPKIMSIKITKSERRWGSCSAKNRLCFSYRLAEYLGSSFLDAIIIHELAHLIEKNHQKPFWSLVKHWMPEYESVMKNQDIGE